MVVPFLNGIHNSVVFFLLTSDIAYGYFMWCVARLNIEFQFQETKDKIKIGFIYDKSTKNPVSDVKSYIVIKEGDIFNV